MDLVRIVFKSGKATFRHRTVQLTELQYALLKGKGEGSSVLIRKEHLKYKEDDDTENNKQDTPRSIYTE
jgi:hypothetical protein